MSRGFVQCGEHFQFIEIGLHIFGESASWTVASVAVTNGHGYHQILFSLCTGAVRFQQWLESIALVSFRKIYRI